VAAKTTKKAPKGKGTEVEKNGPGRPEGATDEYVEDRDAELWRGSCRGLLPSTLALTYNISEEHCRRIIRAQREKAALGMSRKPSEVVEDYLLQLDAMIDELAAVSAQNKGSARVTAISARLTTMKEKRDVLQQVGSLPSDLGQIADQNELVQIAHGIVGILQRAEVPSEVMAEIIELVDPQAEAEDVTDAEVVE
jgi:hypothetical protein